MLTADELREAQVFGQIYKRIEAIEDQQAVFREILSRGTNLNEQLPPDVSIRVPRSMKEQ